MKQQIKWLEETNECLLVTEISENQLLVESVTPEQAAQYKAEREF